MVSCLEDAVNVKISTLGFDAYLRNNEKKHGKRS